MEAPLRLPSRRDRRFLLHSSLRAPGEIGQETYSETHRRGPFASTGVISCNSSLATLASNQASRRGGWPQVILDGAYSANMVGGQAVQRDISTGVDYGACDPRKDGEAIPESSPP